MGEIQDLVKKILGINSAYKLIGGTDPRTYAAQTGQVTVKAWALCSSVNWRIGGAMGEARAFSYVLWEANIVEYRIKAQP